MKISRFILSTAAAALLVAVAVSARSDTSSAKVRGRLPSAPGEYLVSQATEVVTTSSTTTTTVPEEDSLEFTGLEISASDTEKVREQLDRSDIKVNADVQAENRIKDTDVDVDRTGGSGVAAVATSAKEGEGLKAGHVDVDISDVVMQVGDVTIGDKKGHRIVAGAVTADEVGGNLSPEVLIKVIQMNLGGIRNCYEQVLKYDNNISGRFYVEITVGLEGAVSHVSVLEDTVSNSDLTGCISAKINRWRFPPPTGGEFKFSYPFNFVQSF